MEAHERIWSESKENLLKGLCTSENGISSDEAKKRLSENGKKKSLFAVFLERFKDLLVIILCVAAAISFISGDRKNMVFSGSLVTYGRANVLVTGTGMNTEIGKIAGLMNATKQRKPLFRQALINFLKNLQLLSSASVLLFFFFLFSEAEWRPLMQ